MFTKRFLAILSVGMLFLAGCTATTTETTEKPDTGAETAQLEGEVTIGGQFPLTGELGAIGNGQKNGALLAVKEINVAGGINGKELKMEVEDDKCDQTLVISAFNKLVGDGVPAVVGSACSPTFTAMAPLATEKKVTIISPSATSKTITQEGGDYGFRTASTDTSRMQKFAQFAIDELENDKLAVVYLNNDYGVNAKDDFVTAYEALGGEIVYEDGFNQGTTDFKTQLQKIKDSGADGFWQISYAEGTGLIYKQARELGVEMLMLNGYEAPEDPQVVDLAKDAHNGVYYAAYQAADPAFVEAYTAEYGEAPVTYAAEAYDAVKLIAWAMQEGAMTGEEIKNKLYEVKDYKGASGTFSIDENGDVEKEFDLVQIVEQKPKVLRPL